MQLLYSSLILASYTGQVEIVKVLLEQDRIEVNAKDIYLFSSVIL